MDLVTQERELAGRLSSLYEEGEASAISDWVMENLTGKKRAARLSAKTDVLKEEQKIAFEKITERLLKGEPVQYVLHESWFMGCRFYVDPRVLIPRPETEELVEWIISNCRFPLDKLTILDVGTGSGCIPVSLKRRLGKAQVLAVDASEPALEVAKKNAAILGTELEFFQMDFLDKKNWTNLPMADILVSNPPYIPFQEADSMAEQVVAFEPSMALFVPNDDPLLFYRALAEFGREKLTAGGQLFAEMHEQYSGQVNELFNSSGYNTEIKNDLQGKPRMIKAVISDENLIL